MQASTLGSVAIGVGSAFAGAVVGFLLSEWSAERRERKRVAERHSRAALTVGTELSLVERWAIALPESAQLVTDSQQLHPLKFPGTTGYDALIQSVIDLPTGLRERAFAKVGSVNHLRLSFETVRRRILDVSRERILRGSDWGPEDASGPEFVALFGKLLESRADFIDGFESLNTELGLLAEQRFK